MYRKILSTETDKSEQAVQKKSDQGLYCFPFHLHFGHTKYGMVIILSAPIFKIQRYFPTHNICLVFQG